jgi:hypothetical protein
LTLIGAALLTGCSGPESELNVMEAVFRHQMAKNSSGLGEQTGVYCLKLETSVGGGDPPAELLQRFADRPVPVRAVSQCRIGGEAEGSQVYDNATGRSGLILSISRVDCTLFGRCSVRGGHYRANLGASGNVYTLRKRGGRWEVSQDRMLWIS